MKSITKWSKAHTLLTVAIVAGVGYWAYTKYAKKPSATTAFTGGEGSYFR